MTNFAFSMIVDKKTITHYFAHSEDHKFLLIFFFSHDKYSSQLWAKGNVTQEITWCAVVPGSSDCFHAPEAITWQNRADLEEKFLGSTNHN